MLLGTVFDINKQDCLLGDVKKTNNIFERMRGLLFRDKLKPQQALWIEPCPSVHTFGMQYSIDVVFLDKMGIVLKVVDNLDPMRIASCRNATVSLELLAGDAGKSGIQPGMKLIWNNKESN